MSPILIPPDNRLLGWSTTDLTLYGAQPLPGMSIGPAAEQPADPVKVLGSDAPTAAEHVDMSSPSALADDGATPIPATPGDGETRPLDPAIAAPAVATEAPSGTETIAAAPTFFLTAPLAHFGLDMSAASGMTGSSASGPVGATTTGDNAPALPQIEAMHAALGDIVGNVASIAALGDTIGHVTDLLDGIAGHDPAAGIGTILDLMKTADIFELRATTEALDHGTAPVLDALIFDITDDTPLLGDIGTHHDDGLLGGIDLDHGQLGLG